ncbi:DUF2637 domain-containing protein [Kocuria sp. SL71]|uniref:DUF2637 domain-containing protein n=1 Tax=Kocuria sp. SL71 TaxID=2995151 RepID=UPI002272BFC0|nr:DUF2637 domain-containing protein [Kocuria sp. SL71]MCY1684036.1 DUF2637 domain-containing protein [Kocuria sp. SL71]
MNDTVAPGVAVRNGGSSRIDPDTRGVQWTVVGLVGLLGLTSFAVSFRALHDVAAWAGIGPGLAWAVPVFIDGAILTYALAVLVHRSRGESVWPSWVSLAVFTAMSVAANGAHAVAAPQEEWWQAWVGAALAALAPLGVFAATEQMARLVVLRPQDRVALSAVEAVLSASVAVEEESSQDETPSPVRGEWEERDDQAAPTVVSAETIPGPLEPSELSEPSEALGVEVESEPDLAVEQELQGDDVAEEAEEASEGDEPEEASAGAEEPSEEDFVAWVQQRRREGEPITGPTAGAFLGVSERTGRNRIKELRSARPELFEEVAA